MAGKPRFEKLLEPFQIKQVKLRNRMVSSAHGMGYAEQGGYVSERDKAFYEQLAKGGVGLLIVEYAGIDSRGDVGTSLFCIDDDKFIPGFSELAQIIHKYGCPTFQQLGHIGPSPHVERLIGGKSLSASPIGDLSSEITIAEIDELVDKFAAGAERARKARFDGVEIFGVHASLINSFFSRAWNRRQDAYGGDLRNRTRFAVEIIQAIKDRVGQDFPLGFRFNGGEYGVENGITSEESQEIGKILQEAGADYLSVSGFGYGSFGAAIYAENILYPEPVEEVRPLLKEIKKPGLHIARAEAIKKVVSIPVMGTGKLDPIRGEWLLRKGKVDLILLGRPLIADPELPNKVASGRVKEIRPCVAGLECASRILKEEPVECRVNAAAGKEREYAIKPAEKKKKVMVVGAGPAGMEAARVAALRGHEVLLYDKEHKLGGLMRLAALVKGLEIEDLVALIRYFKIQLTELGVKIKLGKEVDLSLIEKIKPEAVILATGGKLIVPEIPGIRSRNVLSSSELHSRVRTPLRFFGPKVLGWLTRFWLPIGERVVIMGGLIMGCETAEFLVKRGRKVTIVETSDQLTTGMPSRRKAIFLDWLAKKEVTILTEVKYEQITDKGLSLITREGQRQTIEADTIVVALPPRPDAGLYKTLQGKVPEVHLIGDSREFRLMLGAIEDGLRIACLL